LHGGGGFLITFFGDPAGFTTGFLIVPVDAVSANAGAMIVNAAASRAIFLNMKGVPMVF
jgi:hypothetical protein